VQSRDGQVEKQGGMDGQSESKGIPVCASREVMNTAERKTSKQPFQLTRQRCEETKRVFDRNIFCVH
jgi:hypothetical protein